MDFDFEFELEDDGDSEQEELERQEALKKSIAEREAAVQKRILQRQQEEERWFGKQQKPEARTLKHNLQEESYAVFVEKKQKIRDNFDRVIQHFQKEDDDSVFNEKMRKIKTVESFKNFLVKCHRSIVAGPEKNHDTELHDWLLEFHKETISALRKLTKIPSDVKITKSSAENVFEDVKERALKNNFIDMKVVQERALQRERKEAEELKKMQTEVNLALKNLNIQDDEDGTHSLTEKIQRLSIDRIRDPQRDTSPDRRRLSLEEAKLLENQFSDLYLPSPDKETPTEAEVKYQKSLLDADEEEEQEWDESICRPSLSVPSEHPWSGSMFNKDSEPESDNEVSVLGQVLEVSLTFKKRVLKYFMSEPTDEDKTSWKMERFENKKKKQSKVKFVDYDSPLNKMRIFARPSNRYMADGDNGPTTDYMDLSLREGFLLVHNTEPPFVDGWKKGCVPTRRSTFVRDRKQQMLTLKFCRWHGQYEGNLIGRFWYKRLPENDRNQYYQSIRMEFGLVEKCTKEEVDAHYAFLAAIAYKSMLRRPLTPQKEQTGDVNKMETSPVCGVLLLTDWRLGHLDTNALTNTVIQFLPTNLGATFFSTMADYSIELILQPSIQFHTIIFAFGGSPSFKIEDFLRFWKILIVHTTKTYDVFWMAQDWCDGLPSTQEELDNLRDFNSSVKSVFDTMKDTGHKNYKWCDIRKRCNLLPTQHEPVSDYTKIDRSKLETLYYNYVLYFVNECNCYGFSSYFAFTNPILDDYTVNDSRYPLHDPL
ncbi:hypothetical protein L5515_004478 [Caenorhabditis briggsae]|uniref:Uncharacterized protein n=2 Tax=Caenorhabditis briggsae TaxID=6238 RepID=A0AAE9JD19_CAEBR|nr:hypothetical protein L5515_004478 [Caenorhabditis briggsae]